MNKLVRRTEISNSDAIGVVFEPEQASDHFAVMLGGASGGIPEGPARRLAENGVTAFALGVAAKHSTVCHPQTCGKVERFHQTLKRFLKKQPPARSLAE
ncbi:hypothetical protein EPN29_07800, partial [bacterium]